MGPAECNRGYWYPAGDIVILTPAMFGVAAVTAYACHENNGDTKCDIAPPLAFAATLAALASGIYGIITVSKCRGTPEPEPPPPPSEPVHVRDDDCVKRRAELQRAALAEPDIDKRTQMLQALPSC